MASATRLAPLALLAVVTASVAHFTSKSYFYLDDYLNFHEVERDGLSFSYLTRVVASGHLAPGRRLGDWLIQSFFPLNFGVAQALMLSCLAGSAFVLYRVLVELFGSGPGPLLLTLLYGTSIVHVEVIQWWAAGLLSLPAALLSLVSIFGYLRFYRTASRRWLVVSVAALGVGLLFYVKPLLVPMYLILLRVLVLEPERPLRATVAAAVREWRLWSLYLAPIGVYVSVYLARSSQSSGVPSLGAIVDYVRLSWVRVFAPGVFGFHIPRGEASSAQQIAIVAVQVVLAGLVAVSLLRFSRAWRAWAFFAIAFLANAMLVGLGRINLLGPDVAYGRRYHVEATFLLPIALGAAFRRARLRRAGAIPSLVARPLRRRAGWGVITAATAAHLVLAWSASGRIMQESPGWAAGRYMGNVDKGLRQLARSGVEPTILDGTVPDYVLSSWMVLGGPPVNRYSEIFQVFGRSLSFDRPTRVSFAVGSDGRLRPVTFVDHRGGDAAALLQSGALTVSGATVEVNGATVCVRSGPAPGLLELSPGAPPVEGEWYLELAYVSNQQRQLPIYVDRGGGYPSVYDRAVSVEAHKGANVYGLGGRRLLRLRLDLPPHLFLCLDRLEVSRGTVQGKEDNAGQSVWVQGSSERFDRADNPTRLGAMSGGPTWRTGRSRWGISAQQARVSDPEEGRSMAVVELGHAVGAAEVRVSKVAAQAGLVFRCRDRNNYWAVVALPSYSTWAVIRVVGGIEQVVTDTGLSSTEDGTRISVRMEEDRIDVAVDTQVRTTITDGILQEASRVGMTAGGTEATEARFDDFVAAAAAGGD